MPENNDNNELHDAIKKYNQKSKEGEERAREILAEHTKRKDDLKLFLNAVGVKVKKITKELLEGAEAVKGIKISATTNQDEVNAIEKPRLNYAKVTVWHAQTPLRILSFELNKEITEIVISKWSLDASKTTNTPASIGNYTKETLTDATIKEEIRKFLIETFTQK
jgi:hypothetical protein